MILDRRTSTTIDRARGPSVWDNLPYRRSLDVPRSAGRESVATESSFDREPYIFSFDEDLDILVADDRDNERRSEDQTVTDFHFSDTETTPRESDISLEDVKGCPTATRTGRSSDCSEPESLDDSIGRRMSPSLRKIMEYWNEAGRELVDRESESSSGNPVASSIPLRKEELERFRTIRVPDWAMQPARSPPMLPPHLTGLRSLEHQQGAVHANPLLHKGGGNGLHARSIDGPRDYQSEIANFK